MISKLESLKKLDVADILGVPHLNRICGQIDNTEFSKINAKLWNNRFAESLFLNEMSLQYRIAADLVVVVHAMYATFIVLGLVLIVIGGLRGWRWVRNRTFRIVHLCMILVVVAESLVGITCPLTTYEQRLRELSGESGYQGDFIAHHVHELLFFDFPTWVFTVCYTLFGLVVVLTMWLFPPQRRKNGLNSSETSPPR